MGATALNFKTWIIAVPSHVKLQRGRDGGSSPLPLSIRGPDVCATRWHLASREDGFLSHGENKLKCDASTRLPLIPHFPTCRETTKLPNIAARAEGEAAPPPSLSRRSWHGEGRARWWRRCSLNKDIINSTALSRGRGVSGVSFEPADAETKKGSSGCDVCCLTTRFIQSPRSNLQESWITLVLSVNVGENRALWLKRCSC